ncbi:MAG: deoxyguanosinetriphosphate triphosphohydrolase, partial [Acidobacteriota bacterium]
GHTPFGHMGEKILDSLTSCNFRHYEQSLRVVDKLEYDGKGLNLTDLVRDGILKHSKGFGEILPVNSEKLPITLEGQIVRISDIVAYVNHDLDDALRAGIIKNNLIPESVIQTLGHSFAKRIDRIVIDIIDETLKTDLNNISVSETIYTEIINLRKFLFEKVYLRPEKEKEREKIEKILDTIFKRLIKNPEEYLNNYPENDSIERRAIDFIAGMTDRFALNLFESIIIPKYI